MPKQSQQRASEGSWLLFEIPVDYCLAMKASLSISWNKLQTLRRSAVIVINEVILQTYMFKNIIHAPQMAEGV